MYLLCSQVLSYEKICVGKLLPCLHLYACSDNSEDTTTEYQKNYKHFWSAWSNPFRKERRTDVLEPLATLKMSWENISNTGQPPSEARYKDIASTSNNKTQSDSQTPVSVTYYTFYYKMWQALGKALNFCRYHYSKMLAKTTSKKLGDRCLCSHNWCYRARGSFIT